MLLKRKCERLRTLIFAPLFVLLLLWGVGVVAENKSGIIHDFLNNLDKKSAPEKSSKIEKNNNDIAFHFDEGLKGYLQKQKLLEVLEKLESEGLCLYDYQKEYLLDDSVRKITLKSRQIGFSYIGGALNALLKALVYGRPVVYVSDTDEKTKITRGYIKSHLRKLKKIYPGIETPIDNDNELSIYPFSLNGGLLEEPVSIRFVTGFDPDTVEGYTGHVICDEFSKIRHAGKLYDAVYPSITSDPDFGFEIFCTANGPAGRYYDIWTNNNNDYPDYKKRKITIDDAIVDGFPADKENLFKGLSDIAIREKYYCEIIESDLFYFNKSEIEKCEDHNLLFPNERELDALGIDVGRTTNWSVASGLYEEDGKKVQGCILEMPNMTFPNQRKLLFQLIDKRNPKIVGIEKNGLGFNLFDDLEEEFGENRIIGHDSSLTKKVELTEQMKVDLQSDILRLIPNNNQKAAFLSVYRTLTDTMRVTFKAQEDPTNGTHADHFWALAIANWLMEQEEEWKIEYSGTGEKRAFSHNRSHNRSMRGGFYGH